MILVTGKIVDGLPVNYIELGVLNPIQVNLEEYAMTEIEITVYRNHHNVPTSTLIKLHDGTEIRFKGNAMDDPRITIRDLDYTP